MSEVDGRLARVHQLIDDEPRMTGTPDGVAGRLTRLCCALVRDLPATGAGVSLMTEDNEGGGTVASDPSWRRIEELQFSMGEGPCIDAFSSRRPVLAPDLEVWGFHRWPGYAAAAQENGVRAVFAFPLQVGAARLGALDIYRDEPGSLTSEAMRDAVTFADVAVGILLDGQHLTEDGDLAPGLDDVLVDRVEIYQAQGMVMVDLAVSLTEAMARLRGHAYAESRPLLDVARDVVAGRLRLDRDTP